MVIGSDPVHSSTPLHTWIGRRRLIDQQMTFYLLPDILDVSGLAFRSVLYEMDIGFIKIENVMYTSVVAIINLTHADLWTARRTTYVSCVRYGPGKQALLQAL